MERLGAQSASTLKLSAADITEDLPKNYRGIVIAPIVIDDSHEKALFLASKMISLMFNGSYKRVIVKDRESLEKLMRLASEYLKQIVLHLAAELKVFELDYVAVIVVNNRRIEGIGVVARDIVEEAEDEGGLRGTVLILTAEKLSANDIDRVLDEAQDIAENHALRLGMGIPSFVDTDDVRVLMLSFEEQDVIKIRIKEDYAKPYTIKIPITKPYWSVDDLPPRLREDVEILVVEPIRSSARYAPRGMIIVGPPGVGKSVTAEALANAMNKGVVRIAPSTYRSMWYGMTEKTLHKIFSAIRNRKDVIVLVDDADFLVQRMQAIHEAYIAEVNVWLNILQEPSRPFIVMTTNVPQILDPALLRPGRLDLVVVMGYPDLEMRKKIALRSAKRYGIPMDAELAYEIAKHTRWFNAAEIDSLVRMAASKGKGRITIESIEWAKRRFSINESERKYIQDNLRYYATKVPGLVISYVPKDSEV
ncbi:MAG: ATP-binding protein [Crenarchaeota archaeon]|nr:ATP-binding protein [Thermoproteota archaeon]